jgi:aryl-phospho-beta-D-glucosidase BglC (GH1 family)
VRLVGESWCSSCPRSPLSISLYTLLSEQKMVDSWWGWRQWTWEGGYGSMGAVSETVIVVWALATWHKYIIGNDGRNGCSHTVEWFDVGGRRRSNEPKRAAF